MDKIADELRKLPVEGFIWLHVRAVNTKNNSEIHEAFKQFAKEQCDDNYTIALKTLMGGYTTDDRSAILEREVQELKSSMLELKIRVKELEEKKNPDSEDEDGTF